MATPSAIGCNQVHTQVMVHKIIQHMRARTCVCVNTMLNNHTRQVTEDNIIQLTRAHARLWVCVYIQF